MRLATIASVAALLWSGPVLAHEFSSKGVTVAHPWARATPDGVKVGAAYLEIRAAAGTTDRLVSANSPLAGRTELHTHVMDGNVARMRPVEAVPIPAGSSIVMSPGGYHLMLMDLKQPLKEGDLLKLTLVFEKAGPITVDASVEPIGANGPHGFDKQPDVGGHKH